MKFKVGQKVRFEQVDLFAGTKEIRDGVIVNVESDNEVFVYSKGMKGHSCGGRFKTDEYWFVPNYHVIEVLEEKKKAETIVIYRKDQEVIALDKSTGKKAVAKCHPDDEFDFQIGARVAFDRLNGVEPEKQEDKPVMLRTYITRDNAKAMDWITFFSDGSFEIFHSDKNERGYVARTRRVFKSFKQED